MDIRDFRKQYPEYNEVSDADLAVKLHEKFYADTPFEAFADKFIAPAYPQMGQDAPQSQPSPQPAQVPTGAAILGFEAPGEDLAPLGTGGEDLAGLAGRGVARGAFGLAETVGTAQTVLGERLRDPEGITSGLGRHAKQAFQAIGDAFVKSGATTSEYWKGLAEGDYAKPAHLQKSVVENPEMLANPEYWIDGVAEIAPQLIATLGPAGATAKAVQIAGKAYKLTPTVVNALAKTGAALTGGVFGGAQEGAQTYKQALAKGLTEDEAYGNAAKMTAAAAGLNALSLGKLFSKGTPGAWQKVRKIFTDAVTEGVTEWAEEPAEALILDEDVKQAMIEGVNVIGPAMVFGGASSAVFGGDTAPAPIIEQPGAEQAAAQPEAPQAAVPPTPTEPLPEAPIAPPEPAGVAEEEIEGVTPEAAPTPETEASLSRTKIAESLKRHGIDESHPLHKEILEEHRRIVREDDPVTGFQPVAFHGPTLDRTFTEQKDAETESSYGTIDIINLGGLNKHAGGETAANRHLRNMADIIKAEVQASGIDNAQFFRQGGDELSVVATGVSEKKLASALERAKIKVEGYAKAEGLDQIWHPKLRQNIGTGIYYGVSGFRGAESVQALQEKADSVVLSQKTALEGGEGGRGRIEDVEKVGEGEPVPRGREVGELGTSEAGPQRVPTTAAPEQEGAPGARQRVEPPKEALTKAGTVKWLDWFNRKGFIRRDDAFHGEVFGKGGAVESNGQLRRLRRKARRTNERGLGFDQFAIDAFNEGLIPDSNPQTLLDAIKNKQYKPPETQEADIEAEGRKREEQELQATIEAGKVSTPLIDLPNKGHFLINGEKFKVVDVDGFDTVTLKDGEIIELDMGSNVDVDVDAQGRPQIFDKDGKLVGLEADETVQDEAEEQAKEEETILKAEKPKEPEAPKKQTGQLFKDREFKGALEGKLPAGSQAETAIEKAAREREGRDIEAEEKKKQAKLPGGTTAEATLFGGGAKTSPSFIEMPEIVELAKRLMDGKVPKIKRALRIAGGRALGVHRGGTIELRADIFKDPGLAETVLAHEIGHLIDFLPHKTMKRGNILGRIASLKSFMKKDFGELLPNVEIRNELKALTQIWSPFDISKASKSYIKYRHSSKELYADALSVLINDPALLKKHAPGFYEGFFKYLDRKPEVKKVYEEIQSRVTDRKAVIKERGKRTRAAFARGEEAYSEKNEAETRRMAERLKEELVDVNAAIIRKVKQAKKEGKAFSPEENPVFAIEEAAYKASEAKEYLRDVHNFVAKPLLEVGLEQEDLAEFLLHERIINERTEIANPLGFTPETSKEQLEALRGRIGEDGYTELRKAAISFRSIRKETIIPLLKESGMFSPELMKKIEENEHYATFSVVDFLEEKNGRGAGVSSHIFKQYGTLADITSPFTATVMKDIALIRAANINIAAKSTTDFMQKQFPDEIKAADMEWNGKAHVPVEPKDPQEGMIRYLQDGKIKAFYTDKFIADSFNRAPSGTNLMTETLRASNIYFREIFVIRNPGFWMFNTLRDYERAAINLPGGGMVKLLPEYIKAIKPAFKDAFNVPEDITRDMNKKKILISMESRWGFTEEDAQLERMMVGFNLKPGKSTNPTMKAFMKLWDHWGNVGQGIERIPKIAGYRWLKKNTNLSEKEIGHVVRTQVGSPDFLRKGASYNLYNNLFLFSNSIKEGWRGDIEAARERPAEYAYKRALYTLSPKVLMYAASIGLLGAWMKEAMDKVGEFDKTNYLVVPLGESPNGKVVYLRIPQDETGRFLGGVMWKAMNLHKKQDMAGMFDYMSGQAPTVTPSVKLAADTVQYFSGKNPYDWFRGRTVIPEKEFTAGGMRSHKAFLKHMARQSGAGIIYKFPYDDIERIRTDAEKILDAPVASNLIGRFIKVSNVGERQKLRDISQEVRKVEANRQLEVRDRIIEDVNAAGGEVETSNIIPLFRDMKKEKLLPAKLTGMQFRKMYQRYASKTADDPKIDAVINASTNKEKGALLKEYRENMTPAEFRLIKRQLLIEGHMTAGALKESMEVTE
jgi:GGDEF domain-containing protein